MCQRCGSSLNILLLNIYVGPALWVTSGCKEKKHKLR